MSTESKFTVDSSDSPAVFTETNLAQYALGHRKEDYANPIHYNIIRQGILWAVTSAH